MRLSAITWARVMLFGLILATWPVWKWYALRTIDGSDEPYGLLALATLVALAFWSGIKLPDDDKGFVLAAILLAIYLLTFRMLSPFPRAIVAAAAFGTLFFSGQSLVAHAGLLALSLPMIATAQFYLGYPLRILAAETSVAALRACDFAVTREGALLHWRVETIMVDGPCSGVRMLWVGMYLAATVAVWTRLDNLRATILFATAFMLVIGANVVRATVLFFKESRIVPLPEWAHTGIGALLFGCAALLILSLAASVKVKPCHG
jgi:exosortase/archaeosortase family protein